MTSATTQAKLERELYPPITDLLKSEGYWVWEEATIRAGEQGTRTADHVAWRWDGSEIEVLAVEVKPGPADVGLAQAVAYATGFDRVFVAAEEPWTSTGYLATVFERLGLGYIHTSPTRAAIEQEADQSPFIVDVVRRENIARVRLRHLFTESVVGEPVRVGNDRRGHNWGVTLAPGWQICGQVVTGSPTTYLSLLAEAKSVGDAAALLDPQTFASAVASLGPGTQVILRERRHNGRQGFYSDPLRGWSPKEDVAVLKRLLGFARTLSAPRVGPNFEIQQELWQQGNPLTETDARREFQARIDKFRSARTILNGKP
jgi:hypothetical protein